jgi:hypothetical protein
MSPASRGAARTAFAEDTPVAGASAARAARSDSPPPSLPFSRGEALGSAPTCSAARSLESCRRPAPSATSLDLAPPVGFHERSFHHARRERRRCRARAARARPCWTPTASTTWRPWPPSPPRRDIGAAFDERQATLRGAYGVLLVLKPRGRGGGECEESCLPSDDFASRPRSGRTPPRPVLRSAPVLSGRPGPELASPRALGAGTWPPEALRLRPAPRTRAAMPQGPLRRAGAGEGGLGRPPRRVATAGRGLPHPRRRLAVPARALPATPTPPESPCHDSFPQFGNVPWCVT